jgi:hypothetical protein
MNVEVSYKKWSDGAMEYWKKRFTQYSNTPILQED